MPKIQPPDRWERKHYRQLHNASREIELIYQEMVRRFVELYEQVPKPIIPEGGELPPPFSFDQYPHLKVQARAIEHEVSAMIQSSIRRGLESAYILSASKTKAIVKKYLGDKVAEEITPTEQRRATALKAFLKDRDKEFDISSRVWDIARQGTDNITSAIDLALLKGSSADELSRDIRKYLNRPNELYRRVRDERGVLHLSKRAREYHPGRGVYRSSYQNARRLAGTEINRAYRKADSENWKSLDMVVGIKISLSNNHTCKDSKGIPRPFTDICDDLAGDYPKDFVFTGWHPNCRCISTPILKTEEECDLDREKILAGDRTDGRSVNEVKDIPPQFREWQEKNAERIERARERGKLPYFIRDNEGTIRKYENKGREGYFDTYRDYTNKGGGKLLIDKSFSIKENRKEDFFKIRTIGDYMAKNGHDVNIPNVYHYKDPKYKEIFKIPEDSPYYRKCPDLLIDGKIYEFEGYKDQWKKEKVGRMINHGTKQAPNIIIDNTNGCSERYIRKLIYNRNDIEELWVYEKGKIRMIYKKQKATKR